MRSFYRLLCLLACWALPALFLHANDSAASPLVVRVFSADRIPIEGLYLQVKPGVYEPIVFRSRLRSRDYEIETAADGIIFYRRTGVDNRGRPVFEPEIGATIAPGIREALVFFLRNGNGAMRLQVVDDSLSSFPPGTVRVLNLCGAPLAGKMGPVITMLGEEISDPVSIRHLRDGNNNYVEFAFAVQIGEGVELVYANQIQFSADTRSILVLLPPRRANSVSIHTYLLEDRPRPENLAGAEEDVPAAG